MTDEPTNHGRLIKLGVFVALLALINVAVFGGLFADRTINLHWRVLATPSDDAGPYLLVQFATSDQRAIKSIEVQRLSEEGDVLETIWAVSGKSEPTDTFTFGSTLNGLERTDGQDGRPRLRPGNTYRLKLHATGFRGGELEFET